MIDVDFAAAKASRPPTPAVAHSACDWMGDGGSADPAADFDQAERVRKQQNAAAELRKFVTCTTPSHTCDLPVQETASALQLRWEAGGVGTEFASRAARNRCARSELSYDPVAFWASSEASSEYPVLAPLVLQLLVTRVHSIDSERVRVLMRCD